MPVAEYTPRYEPTLHAVLWTGDANDLEGMPDVNRLSRSALVNGVLSVSQTGEKTLVARPNKDYIVRGVTGYFFAVPKEEFERTYVPVESPPTVDVSRDVNMPSDVAETIKESINYAKRSVSELGQRSLTPHQIDFATSRFDGALAWLKQHRPREIGS